MILNKSAFNFEFEESPVDLFIKSFNFESFFKHLKSENTEHYNYLMYYYYLFMSNHYPENSSYYSRLKEFTYSDIEKLDANEISARFHNLYNYCLLMVDQAETEFLLEGYNVLKFIAEKKMQGVFLTGKHVNMLVYRGFVLFGLANKEFDEVEKFILEYGLMLDDDSREYMLGISSAWLYFERKEYDRALDCISKINCSYSSAKLDIKQIQIKIFYETNDYNSLFPLLDTSRHYVRREKSITEIKREKHENFLYFTGKFAKMKSSGIYDGLHPFMKEINKNVKFGFNNKLWLLEKVVELEKKSGFKTIT